MQAAAVMQEAPGPGRAMSVVGEVLAVLRLALTMRLDASRLVGRDATIALLGAASLAVWIILGRTDINGAARFEPSGVAEMSAVAAAALALAWLAARLSRPPLPVRQTLWLVAGYLPAAAAVGWVLNQPISTASFKIIAGVAAAHAALYFFFGLRALGARPQWLPFAALVCGTVAVIALHRRTDLDFAMWKVRLAPDQVADYRESRKRTEELMYLQSDRIDAALHKVPADANQAAMYFVGFAGYGPQKVFADEIALAARRVDERYGIADRRVLLVNDRRDFDRYPLASSTGLARTLAGIGARMDRDRDVLFLALSSHGKKKPYIVVQNGALPLDELTVGALATMLRESHIRWKVLVISACYAGAFIGPLRDPDTVIIAAAAPDKTSFGCNDRRELTYFGQAFYRDALPKAASLREAFEIAAADIARREKAEGLVPSEPQAYFGAAIERKLGEIEAARLQQDLRPQPAKGPGEHERVDQSVNRELERGAPLARVPD
jgi:hypothetical protein